MNTFLSGRRLSVVLILLTLLAHAAQPAHAATISVNTLADENNSDGDCSLREAVIAANTNAARDACPAGQDTTTDIIVLAGGSTYNLTVSGANENAAALGDLDIINNSASVDLQITTSGGYATVSESASQTDRIFDVRTGANAQFMGLIITGGSQSDGGGIYNTGTLTLSDTKVSGNTAGFNGGGIFNLGTITIQNGSVIGGTGAGNNVVNGSGGGIFISSGSVTIDNSTVSGNSASSDGGGIYVVDNTTLTIQNNSVIGGAGAANSAVLGGGIYNASGTTISGSTVSANTASSNGGGLYNTDTLNVQNSSLIGGAGAANSAVFGGGVYNASGTTTIDASTISANTASDDGGGIYNISSTVIVQNNSLIGGAGAGNTAASTGGGIASVGGSVTVTSSTVSGNSAPTGGGITHGGPGTLTIQSGSLIGGVGAANSAGQGGGIWFGASTLTINASTISANTATSGGGIYLNTGNLNIQNGSVIGGTGAGNSSTGNGGGIYKSGGAGATISASTISANTAGGNGGGIFMGQGLLTINNGTRIGGWKAGNSATNGGGIYVHSGAPTITASHLLYNTATSNGGAVYNNVNVANATDVINGCIVGNSVPALHNQAAASQLATGNWWGVPSGPNPPGSGDTISGTWDTTSFLTTPPAGCGPKYEPPADFNGDGDSEVVIFRQGAWHMYNYSDGSLLTSVWTGMHSATAYPVMMDFDGDTEDDLTVYDSGAWHFFNDDGTYNKGLWVAFNAIPAPADYDGNGVDDVVLYDLGAWHKFDFTTGAYLGGVWTGTGTGSPAYPAPMDYDGDGTDDYTVYNSGAWHFFNDNGSYNKGIWVAYLNGIPVPGDYNGDLTEDVVLWVEDSGGGAWHWFDFATGAYVPENSVYTPAAAHKYALPRMPAPLDYDGDGDMDYTVYLGGPWNFFAYDGSFVKNIPTGGVAGDVDVSGRPALP